MLKKLILIMIILLMPSLLASCKFENVQHVIPITKKNISLEELMTEFSEALAKKDLSEMSLEVYYMDPTILMYSPNRVEDLIGIEKGDIGMGFKVVISNNDLLDNINALKQIRAENFIPVHNQRYYMHATLCFLFQTKNNNQILEIAYGGYNEENHFATIFINGFEVEANDVFFNLVSTFLPKKASDWFLS